MEPTTAVAQDGPPLNAEQLQDLRRLVLEGKQLTLEQSRQVVAAIRQNRTVAVLAGEGKPKKGKSKKEGLSDAQLDADLASLGL